MFMLYAVVIGLLAGLALGGRVGRLAAIKFHWAWVAIAGLAGQLVLFSDPVTAVVGDLGPPLYVGSTLIVLIVVLRNVPNAPGLALVALGAASNLAAIVANGGFMPTTPEAVAAAGLAPTTGYSNSVESFRPALEPLIDRFALPPWVWHANVFSVGDVLIGVGVVIVMVVAMRRKGSLPEGSTDAPAGGAAVGGGSTADGRPTDDLIDRAIDGGPTHDADPSTFAVASSWSGRTATSAESATAPAEAPAETEPSPLTFRSRWARADLVVGPRLRVAAFSFALAAAGVAGFVFLVPGLDVHSPFRIPWPLFALIYYIAETNVIDVHFRRETHSFSLSEVPAVLGLFFVDPPTYVLGLLVGAAAALIRSRQPAAKIFFNLSHFLLGCVLSLAVFHFIAALDGPPNAPDPMDWVAAFAASLLTSTIGALAIATVITLSGGAPQFQRLPEMLQVGALFAVTNTALALLAVDLLWIDPVAVWLVVVPVGTIFIAYRAYLSERQKHESLELLYESSRIFQRSPELDSAILALLEHARVMFRTDRAELILAGGEDGVPLRTSAGPGDKSESMVPAPEEAQLIQRLRDDPRPSIYDAGNELPAAHQRLFRFAMVSPLRGEAGILGAMIVADRVGENDGFGPDELRMFETVANQAAVALENGQLEQSLAELSRLKEELRHQAFHDPLTGLANRALFVQAVEERLVAAGIRGREDAAAGDGPGAAAVRAANEDVVPVVLFLDLDDFKMVNDTLGHGIGDRLLQGVAERVVAAIRADDLAARLGGDEFAILLTDGPNLRQAKLVADRIAAALRLPFRLGGRELTIGASIGVALARPGQTSQEVLRNADVAMYAAKARGKGQQAIWDPDMHTALIERHELSSELTRAIAGGDVRVAYQPLVALEDGDLVGFEALARWDSPTRGPIAPELFVRLAEESGGIIELGRSVLLEACRQAAAWTDVPGLEASVISVNLSPYQLRRREFTNEVLAILGDTGLDPRRLVLEMTETAMFSDIDATISKLQVLRGHGVRIAVDDFGTGYSSLRWLRQFPVDILKLAREFVVDGDGEPGDWAFAHAIVVLGRTLGLKIVAEGIETAVQFEHLRELGCDYGQGYLFSRAVEVDGVLEMVASIRGGDAPRPAVAGTRRDPAPALRLARAI